MQIKVYPHSTIDELPGSVEEFLSSLKLDPTLWRQEQVCEVSADTRFEIFGGLLVVPNELWRSAWVWRLETKLGTSRFYLGEDCLAADFLGADESLEVAVAALPTSPRHIRMANLDIRALPLGLQNLSNLTSLHLNGCESLIDVSRLSGLPELATLDVSFCKSLSDLSPIARLKHLVCLRLNVCESVTDLSPLSDLLQLSDLGLSFCKSLADLSPLADLSSLARLYLHDCRSLADVSPLATICNLAVLDLGGCTSLSDASPIASLSNLRRLDLSFCRSLSDLSPIASLPHLSDLSLCSFEALTEISPLAGLSNLRALNLGWCISLFDLSALASLVNLADLNLQYCKTLEDLSPLASLSSLKRLDLRGCESISDIAPLAGLSNLSVLNLRGCKTLASLSSLTDLLGLVGLDITGCDYISDLTPVGRLLELESFRFSSRRVQSIDLLRNHSRLREVEKFDPPQVAELLAHTAAVRRDKDWISLNSEPWLVEAQQWNKAVFHLRDRFAATLGDAYSLLGAHQIEVPYQEFLLQCPEFTSAPWRAWFGGTLQESDFDLYRRRVECVPLAEMTSGAIGGACLTLPLQEHLDWSRQWLADLEKSRLGDAKTLLQVAPEICLAYARSGDRQALRRWLDSFTDPSDPAALDPVHAALGRFQIGGGDLAAAGNHVHAIHSPIVRDPILGELVIHLAESDEDLASVSLLLIEDQALRIDLAKKLAAKASASEVLIHRCIVAAGESSQALADLISTLPQTSRSELVAQLSKRLQTDRKTMLLGIADELEIQARLLRAKAASEPVSA